MWSLWKGGSENRCTSPQQTIPYILSTLLLRIIINFYFIRKSIF